MVARIGDRFGFVRKLSRQFEGQDKKAGLLSDLFSTCVALYERNPELINELGGKAKEEFATRQAAREAAKVTPNGNGNGIYQEVS